MSIRPPRLLIGLLCLLLQAPAWAQVSTNEITNGIVELPPETAATSENLVTNAPALPATQPLEAGPTIPGSGQLGSPLMGNSIIVGSSAYNPAFAATAHYFAVGPFEFFPSVAYSFVNGTGIDEAPGQSTSSAISTVAPDLRMKFSSLFTIDYQPSFTYYSAPGLKDSVNQSLVLQSAFGLGDWNMSLSQSYVDSTTPLVETAANTEQIAYVTTLSGAHDLGYGLSVNLSLEQTFRSAPGYSDLSEWATSDALNYQIIPQLTLGVSGTVGYDELSGSSDMPFESVQGQLTFKPRQKLILSLSAGLQERQFINPSAPSLISPIYSVSAIYPVFRNTTLTIFASRSSNPSIYANQVTDATSVGFTVRQIIYHSVFVEVDGGYTDEPFATVVPGEAPQFYFGAPPPTAAQTVIRSDTDENLTVSLGMSLSPRITSSFYFTENENNSSLSEYSFKSTQEGFSLMYRY